MGFFTYTKFYWHARGLVLRWFGTGIKIFVVVIELFLIRSLKMANSKSLSIEFNYMDEFKSIFDVTEILRKEVA